MTRSRHVPDDRLLSLYLGEDAPTQGDDLMHLQACPACAERYRTVGSDVGPIGRMLQSWADQVFTADKLSRQRQHIAGRLARLGTQARVLEFPQSTHRQHPARGTSRVTTRWIAAAAAAGLIVGLGTGVVVDHRVHVYKPSPALTGQVGGQGVARLAAPSGTSARHLNEDQFLSDVEAAVDESRAPELQALEAFTPRIQEISATLK